MLNTEIKWNSRLLFVMIALTASVFAYQGCSKEKVIIYRNLPDEVSKLSPANGDTVLIGPPVLIWQAQSGR